MQNNPVSKTDSETQKSPRFTRIERIVLASGCCVMSIWIGGLAWAGYKLVTFII